MALVEYVESLSSISEQSFEVVEYNHSLSPVPDNYAYVGGVYAPTLDRIYLVPNSQAPRAVWHYIDCSRNGAVVAYTHSQSPVPVNEAYVGGVYAPTLDRIYFVPRSQADEANWHYIEVGPVGYNITVDVSLMSGAMFNKF